MRRRFPMFQWPALTLAALTAVGCAGSDFFQAPLNQQPILCGGSIQGIALALTGDVTTFAGTFGVSGNADGVGNAASFEEPYGITTDGLNLYVSDKDGDAIRKIEISSRQVTTLVPQGGGLNEPVGITTDGAFVYVCDSNNDAIQKVDANTGAMTLLAGGTSGAQDGLGPAAQFREPYGITVVGDDLFVADRDNHAIRRVNKNTGEVTTLAGAFATPGSANGFGGDARFNEPMSVTTDCTNLYVGDWNNYTVRKIVIATGEVTTFAGTTGQPGTTNGLGTGAQLLGPRGLTSDGRFLYVADFYNRHGGQPIPVPEPVLESSLIRRIDLTNGEVTTLAGAPDTFGAVDAQGADARFRQPSGVTTDGRSLFVTDRQNNAVRQIQ